VLRERETQFFENKAVEFLQLQGYRILKRNFATRFGEIDVVAQKRGGVSLVEVKARKQGALVSGREAVDFRKRARIRKAARACAATYGEKAYRFDVVEIVQGILWRQYFFIRAAFDMENE
jgi:putative endonuclease